MNYYNSVLTTSTCISLFQIRSAYQIWVRISWGDGKWKPQVRFFAGCIFVKHILGGAVLLRFCWVGLLVDRSENGCSTVERVLLSFCWFWGQPQYVELCKPGASSQEWLCFCALYLHGVTLSVWLCKILPHEAQDREHKQIIYSWFLYSQQDDRSPLSGPSSFSSPPFGLKPRSGESQRWSSWTHQPQGSRWIQGFYEWGKNPSFTPAWCDY